jgi:hypothetical protein
MDGKEKHTLANRIDIRLVTWDNDGSGLRLIVVTVRNAKHCRKEYANELGS